MLIWFHFSIGVFCPGIMYIMILLPYNFYIAP